MSMRKLFPIVRTIFAKQIKAVDEKIDLAKNAYETGDKKLALSLYKEAVNLDGTCIGARGKIGKITKEIQEEKKEINTNSFKK